MWIRRNETLNIEEIKQNLKDLEQSPEIRTSKIPFATTDYDNQFQMG